MSKIMIGRSSNCHFKLDDKSVSRDHAVIEVHGRQLFLRDLESSNGTYICVNNDRERVMHVPVSLETKVAIGDIGPILVSEILKNAENIRIVANSKGSWVEVNSQAITKSSLNSTDPLQAQVEAMSAVKIYPRRFRCHNCASVMAVHNEYCDDCGASSRHNIPIKTAA